MALVKYKNSAGNWIPVQLSIPTIEVDSLLNSTSTNPVQNKVIKEVLDSKIDINAISKVAISGNYSDLDNLPTFATVNGQDITKTDNIIIKDKVYTIYTQLLTGQSSLTSDQIASNKSAYDSVLENENAVYYFASSNLNTALLSTYTTILSDSSVTFVSNIIAGSDLKDVTVTMVQVTINSEGNIVEESNSVVNIPTEEKVQELLSFKQDNLVSGVNIKTINNQSILIENEDITNIQISSDLIVDSTMSETSENPVQNKIIKAYVDDAISELNVEVVDNLESTETTSALSANQGRVLKELVDSKMDSTTFKTINGETILGSGNIDTSTNIPSCTIYTNIEQEDPRANLTHEQALFNKDAFIKIKESVSNKTGLDITVVTISYDGTEISYKNCFITNTVYSDSGLVSVDIESAVVVQNINKPYISHIKISQFTNGWEYYAEGWDIPAACASVNKKYLATSADVGDNTTTYIGAVDPSTISSKYNLWVDTTNEDVVFKYKDENNDWQVLPTGGNDGEIKIYKVYQNPQSAEELAANKAAYDSIAAEVSAMYQMYYVLGWTTASLTVSFSGVCALVFTVLAQTEDDGIMQNVSGTLIINSDGSIYTFSENVISIPSTEKVEEMIAQSGGSVSEEKEVYIGSDEPSEAKLWIDSNTEKIKYKDENEQWQEIAINSTYDIVSETASGLAPKLELNGSIQPGDWVLSSTNDVAPTWKQVLAQVESGTKDTLAYYSDANTVASFDKMVGHTGQPVFINNGIPTPISESIGDAYTPIYMNNGQFYPTTGMRFNQYYTASGSSYVVGDAYLTTSAVLDRQIYILYNGANLILPDPSRELVGAIVFVKNAYGDPSKVTGKIVGSSQNIVDADNSVQTITLANNHSGFFLCVVYGNNYKWVHFYCS